MRVRSAGRRAGGMTGILGSHHFPAAGFLLHLVMEGHALRWVRPFRGKDHRDIRLLPIELDRGNIQVHRRQIEAAAGEMIQHALPDRIFTLVTAIASGKTCQEQQNGANSHT